MFDCSNCHKKSEDIDQNEFKVSGRLEKIMMSDKEIDIEENELEKGDIAYYYFNESDEECIKGNQNAAGKARSLCEECIYDTIEKTFTVKDPHYGDGVYLTLHNDLNNSNEYVKNCHGNYVANRSLRVKFRINKPELIIKVSNTGGVIKTNEGEKNYKEGKLIFLNKDKKDKIATYLGIEEYKDGSWVVR